METLHPALARIHASFCTVLKDYDARTRAESAIVLIADAHPRVKEVLELCDHNFPEGTPEGQDPARFPPIGWGFCERSALLTWLLSQGETQVADAVHAAPPLAVVDFGVHAQDPITVHPWPEDQLPPAPPTPPTAEARWLQFEAQNRASWAEMWAKIETEPTRARTLCCIVIDFQHPRLAGFFRVFPMLVRTRSACVYVGPRTPWLEVFRHYPILLGHLGGDHADTQLPVIYLLHPEAVHCAVITHEEADPAPL